MNEKRKQTACFTGHRQIEGPAIALEHRLEEIIENLIKEGYLYFGAGGARGFDALAAKATLKLKERHPGIHLILVLPFDRQYEYEQEWTQAEIEQYDQLKSLASKVVVLSPAYHKGVYYRRNRHLVDHSSICIAYMTRKSSGTGYTVNYAHTKRVPVINIAAGC